MLLSGSTGLNNALINSFLQLLIITIIINLWIQEELF